MDVIECTIRFPFLHYQNEMTMYFKYDAQFRKEVMSRVHLEDNSYWGNVWKNRSLSRSGQHAIVLRSERWLLHQRKFLAAAVRRDMQDGWGGTWQADEEPCSGCWKCITSQMMSSFQKSCLQSALSPSGGEPKKMMLECLSCFLDVVARLPCHHSITSHFSHIINLDGLGAAVWSCTDVLIKRSVDLRMAPCCSDIKCVAAFVKCHQCDASDACWKAPALST